MIVNDINVTVNGLSDITPADQREARPSLHYGSGRRPRHPRLRDASAEVRAHPPHHGLPRWHDGSLEQRKAGRRA